MALAGLLGLLGACADEEPFAQERSREDRQFIAAELARFHNEFKAEVAGWKAEEVLRHLTPAVYERERALMREELRAELLEEARMTAAQECWSVCNSLIPPVAAPQGPGAPVVPKTN
jgi:hypothetical protein